MTFRAFRVINRVGNGSGLTSTFPSSMSEKCKSRMGGTSMNKEREKRRRQAFYLRQAGYSFGQIAKELNIPRSTVKSWFYRTPENVMEHEYMPSVKRCPQCGKELPPSKYRPRRFCSDECRVTYWTTHGEQINRQSAVSTVCPVCHKTFQDYANHHRKYCCHECYIADRYYGGVLSND